jgi:hypothetical protein
MSVLKGPRAKLDRANAQAAILHDELLSAIEPEPDGIAIIFDHHTHHVSEGTVWDITAKVGDDLPQLRVDFGLALGDCLHNFRGALDHTAWWLVRAAKVKLTTDQRRRVQFPMATTRTKYWGNTVHDRLPGVSKSLLTLIERYQPYRRSVAGDAIRYLRDLTNLDKHRTIIIAPTYMGEGTFDFSWQEGQKIGHIEWARAGTQIKRGTKIATIALLSPPPMKPKMTVNGKIDFAPAFPKSVLRPYAGRIPISARIALEGIAEVCNEILSKIEAQL